MESTRKVDCGGIVWRHSDYQCRVDQYAWIAYAMVVLGTGGRADVARSLHGLSTSPPRRRRDPPPRRACTDYDVTLAGTLALLGILPATTGFLLEFGYRRPR